MAVGFILAVAHDPMAAVRRTTVRDTALDGDESVLTAGDPGIRTFTYGAALLF